MTEAHVSARQSDLTHVKETYSVNALAPDLDRFDSSGVVVEEDSDHKPQHVEEVQNSSICTMQKSGHAPRCVRMSKRCAQDLSMQIW